MVSGHSSLLRVLRVAIIALAVGLVLPGLYQSHRRFDDTLAVGKEAEVRLSPNVLQAGEGKDLKITPFFDPDNNVSSKESGAAMPFFSSTPHDYVLQYPEKLRLDKGDVRSLSANRIIHVLSHTHWDREWYISLEEFRGSLLIELDRVLEMLTNTSSHFHHFHLDGQHLMMEDYLEVRPSMRRTVLGLNKAGKLTLGPFYSQPDVFLSSGEALIRNLMLGMSLGSEMGGTSTVGYLADTFGFIGQLPQLLRGVGIRFFVSGRFAKTGSSEGYWVGPDGSMVLFAYLGNWYCHAIGSFRSPNFSAEQAKHELQRLDSDLVRAGAKSKHRLAMYGCDHFMTDPEIGNKLKIMNEAAKEDNSDTVRVVQTNIDDYMRLLEKDLQAAQLPKVVGEVREGVDMLVNSASTKMSIKQQNFKVQSLMEKWVEPMEAYGWVLGRRYDSDRIWHAWKPILQTHAHDSICSTSASTVIHDIVNRLSRAEQSAYRIIADQAGQIVPAMIKKLLPSASTKGEYVLVVNPTNTVRFECITFTLLGSRAVSQGHYKHYKDLLRPKSSVYPLILTSVASKESFELPNTDFRQVKHKSSHTYLANLHLPPNGIALLQLIETDTNVPRDSLGAEINENEVSHLENKYLSVVVNEHDGSCSLTHLESGHSWMHVNKLWRSTESGTAYIHKTGGKQSYVSDLHVVTRKKSALFSSIRLQGKLGISDVSLTYVLFAKSKSLQIEMSIENAELNNHIVASFPVRKSGSDTTEEVLVHVDGNFEYVNRSKMTGRYVHQNRFTSMYSSGSSLTIANRGIPEYKVGHTGSMEMTLFRGVNRLGDWIAGPLTDDVSQELGKMTFQYAVIPDTCHVNEPSCCADLEARNFVDPVGSFASWVQDGYRPERYIDMDVSPLSVVSALSTISSDKKPIHVADDEEEETSPSTGSLQLFDLKPQKLILSAVKKAESKEALVVRVYNPTNQSLDASLSSGVVKITGVKHVLLNENKVSGVEEVSIQRGGDDFHFTAGAYKIVTLLLSLY